MHIPTIYSVWEEEKSKKDEHNTSIQTEKPSLSQTKNHHILTLLWVAEQYQLQWKKFSDFLDDNEVYLEEAGVEKREIYEIRQPSEISTQISDSETENREYASYVVGDVEVYFVFSHLPITQEMERISLYVGDIVRPSTGIW